MSNAFTNFLSTVGSGIFGNDADLKDYQHASRLYVQDRYIKSPKFGFLYYVVFNFNQKVTGLLEKTDLKRDVGFLVKKIDLPKFDIETETLNQYNRKTIIQKTLKYGKVNVEFHDDNGNLTRDLWKSYYQYNFADSLGDKPQITNRQTGRTQTAAIPRKYTDTKYGSVDYTYGLNNGQEDRFFLSIDIYVLHNKRFSQFTLVNPLISSWAHDTLDQEQGNKVLINRMELEYETVLYSQGKVKRSRGGKPGEGTPPGFASLYYDTTPSPLRVGGKGSLFGAGGVMDGIEDIFGEDGALKNLNSPLDYLNLAIQGKNLAQSVGNLSKAGLRQEGYSILNGVLAGVQANPAGTRDYVNTQISNLGVKIFSSPTNNGGTVASAVRPNAATKP